jgi:hypothetical protein
VLFFGLNSNSNTVNTSKGLFTVSIKKPSAVESIYVTTTDITPVKKPSAVNSSDVTTTNTTSTTPVTKPSAVNAPQVITDTNPVTKPSTVDSPYVTTDTTPIRLAAAPVAGGGISTVVAAVANTVSANTNTDTSTSSTGSNVSYYASGIEGITGLANYGRVFDGANVYVTLEQQQYNTYNQTIGIGNSISVTGNITTSSGYFIGNGSQLTGIAATYGNANVVANLAALGSNPVSTTGNVTAGYFIGNGSQLTGISASSNKILNGNSYANIASANGPVVVSANGNSWTFSTNSTLTAPGGSQWQNAANSDAYFTSSLDGYVHLQSLFADGNIGSEMFLQHGLTTITAHSLGANTDYVWTFDNGGNLTLPGNTFQINYANGDQVTLGSGASNYIVNGNSYANIANANGSLAININGGNTWTFDSVNTLTAPGGSRWQNQANADAYFTSSIDGYVHLQSLFADGNVGSEMFLQHGLATITAHSLGANADYTWTFDNGGNLTLPGNTFQINYANGTPASLGSTYGNANVVANLAALGSNPISTTGTVTAGNITGGNILTAGLISATGNITGGNILFGSGIVSGTGNITGGNLDLSYMGGAAKGNLTGGNISVTGNITGGNISTAGLLSTGGNVTGGNILTAGAVSASSTITGANLSTGGTVSATGNVAGGNIVTGGLISATGNITSAGNILNQGFVSSTGNAIHGNILTGGLVSATGNITGGNLSVVGTINGSNINLGFNLSATGTVTGSNFNTTGLISAGGNVTVGNLLTAGVISATSTITSAANITGGNILTAGVVTATGNIVTAGNFVGNGAALTNVTVNVAGNIVGTQSNVTLVAGSYNWTFNNTGNLTLPGNTFSVNYANNTPVNAVTRFEGAWTVPTGNSTQSFTVGANETYYMWVDCNIPNGILAWNATATVTNTNVPVVGAQYAWVYSGGGTPIDFTSIPNQFTGTANTIVRSSTAPSATTNVFDFGINNTSGNSQTVRYGWIAIS